MGRKASDPANAFSVRVLHAIEEARTEMGMTQKEMLERAEISPNYFYKRLRGEVPLNTNDVHNLAEAIGHNAIIIMERAADGRAVATERIAPVIDGGFGNTADPEEERRVADDYDGDPDEEY